MVHAFPLYDEIKFRFIIFFIENVVRHVRRRMAVKLQNNITRLQARLSPDASRYQSQELHRLMDRLVQDQSVDWPTRACASIKRDRFRLL